MTIKKPASDDYPDILALLEKAFAPSTYESTLIRNLRENRKVIADFIIEENGLITAFICYPAAYNGGGKKIGCHIARLPCFRKTKKRTGTTDYARNIKRIWRRTSTRRNKRTHSESHQKRR